VPSDPVDDDRPAGDADDARDDAERRVRRGQARALLDVHFEERVRQLAARDQGARPRAAALLVPEDGDRPAAGPLDRLDRCDDAERAVELAALGNRVEV